MIHESTISSRVSGFLKQQEEFTLAFRDYRVVLQPELLGRMIKDAVFMAGQNDPGRQFAETLNGSARLVDAGIEVAIPGPETGEIVITGEKDGSLTEKEGKVTGGVSGRRDDVHGDAAEVDRFAADQETGGKPRPEMKLISKQRFPKEPFGARETVPVQEGGNIGKRRRIPGRNPEGEVVEEVEMHEVILVPVAEPDHLHLLFGAQPDQPFPIRGRVDENARPLDIEGVAEGIASPIVARKKADRAE